MQRCIFKQRYLSKYGSIWLVLGYLDVLYFQAKHLGREADKEGITISFPNTIWLFFILQNLDAGKKLNI